MSSQVQRTNDSSIVSKSSIVQQGYFKDDYIHNFVSKESRRSPLINLGYYVRAVVIEKVLLEFIRNVKCAYQILSLGAGFDTSFFRLSDLPECESLIYFEIDLPEVVERKASIINSCDDLKRKLKNIKVGFSDHGIWSKNYRLLAGDLRDLCTVKNSLNNFGFDGKKLTLVLSECSIMYMDESSSRNLINFTGEIMQDAVFITYEQICPDTSFGIVMMNHFETINSPLLSISSYPELKDQERRFLSNGWQQCQAVSVWEAFLNCKTEEERLHALRLEPFDEWEEWHLTCNHYALVVAAKGSLKSWIPFPNFGNVISCDCFFDFAFLDLEFYLQEKCKLFGHCSVMYTKTEKYILNIGGFGQLGNGGHRRLKNPTCFKLEENKFNEIETYNADIIDFDFMHHSCTVIDEPEQNHEIRFILYGGRKSPLQCVNSVPKLVHCRFDKVVTIEMSCLIKDDTFPFFNTEPEPRWRHSACIVKYKSLNVFVVFGGCSQKLKVLNDLWMIKLSEPFGRQQWDEVCTTEGPCGRFSHSVSVNANEMYLSGGLNEKLEALSDLWVFDVSSDLWLKLPIFGVIPRYGHTSHIIKNRLGLLMILIGGVSTHRERWPGIAVIDVIGLNCVEYKLPGVEPAKSIMLQNHSSVLTEDKKSIFVCGGGGNCFSFGTKFNSYIMEIPLSQWSHY